MTSTIYNKKHVFKVLLFLSFVSIFALSSTNTTSAVSDSYTLLAPIPGIDADTKNSSIKTIPKVTFQEYVSYAMNLLIALAAVAAVFEIVYGGIEYMTTGSFMGKKDGITRVRNAIYGLLLVLSSYLILRTINPNFVKIPSTLVPQLGETTGETKK